MFWKRMFGKKPAAEQTAPEQEPEQLQEQQQEEQHEQSVEEEQQKSSGFFKRLVSGLEKTKQQFVSKVEQITTGRKVDESLFEELEEVLIQQTGVPPPSRGSALIGLEESMHEECARCLENGGLLKNAAFEDTEESPM